MRFADRQEAGRQLAERLMPYQTENPLILALPRGGVVTGFEVAQVLKAPLDVMIVRKLGAPEQPELGIGAVAPNGIRVLDWELIRFLGISEAQLEAITRQEMQELERRLRAYRGDGPPLDVRNRTVIVVDDGLATGVTARAAILALRQMQPRKIVLAVPVSPPEAAERMRADVDELVCLHEPPDFLAVGAWYRQFDQVTDDEVIALLRRARESVQPR